MAERLPYPIFESPLAVPPLTEVPSLLRRRPNSETATNAYNRGLTYLMERGQVLEQRRINGEFASLGLITEKIETGGVVSADEIALMRDFRALIDANDAQAGRRNLNIARHIEYFKDIEASGDILDPQQALMKERYQSGDFHLILSEDHALSIYSSIDRFTVPVREADKNIAFIDGAPVDGIIRELDRRITETRERRDISRWQRRSQVNNLRRDRDVLFTASTPLLSDENIVTHARKQYEAYIKSVSPLLSEWEKPDWYKAELLLKDRKVLNLQRGRNRWGCIPFLALLPIPIFIWQALQAPQPTPVIVPAPVIVNQDACYGVEGGKLRIEIFNRSKDAEPSVRGANQREMAYQYMGWNQRNYRPSSDEELIARVNEIENNNPAYAGAYYAVTETDQIQTGQRLRGDKEQDPWVREASDFSEDFVVLASCLSPEQRDQLAKRVIAD